MWRSWSLEFLLEPEVSSCCAAWYGLEQEVASRSSWWACVHGIAMSLLNNSYPPCLCYIKTNKHTSKHLRMLRFATCGMRVPHHVLSFQPVEMAVWGQSLDKSNAWNQTLGKAHRAGKTHAITKAKTGWECPEGSGSVQKVVHRQWPAVVCTGVLVCEGQQGWIWLLPQGCHDTSWSPLSSARHGTSLALSLHFLKLRRCEIFSLWSG